MVDDNDHCNNYIFGIFVCQPYAHPMHGLPPLMGSHSTQGRVGAIITLITGKA